MSIASVTSPAKSRFAGIPWSWFTLTGPVKRSEYLLVGFGLAIFKYAIEFTCIYFLTGHRFSPIDFVNPWLSTKAPFLVDAPAAGFVWLLFTIPFVWIAIAMSVRRGADIGISPWVGLLILAPIVNLVVMGVLGLLPSNLVRYSPERIAEEERERAQLAAAYQAPPFIDDTPIIMRDPQAVSWKRVLLAVGLGCLTQTVVGAVSVWSFQLYGFILFFMAPVVAGSVTGFVYNHRAIERRLGATIGWTVLMNFASFFLMLCMGIDGAICLVMAYPLLGPLSILGSVIGGTIALSKMRPGVDERKGMIGMMCLLPFCLFLEPLDNEAPVHAVTTSVVIDAPPEVVWEHVIAFPKIDAPMAWYFRLGIAAPMHATIHGQGVGAVRHCEFTTGAFVEPITQWNPPERLSFDVVSQPPPMKEWTPFSHLHPPHLDTGFVSERGEFHLERLANGQTRLHGTTWYKIDVRPRLYWKSLADPVLHAIHRRVLEHIAANAEAADQSP